MDIFRDGAGGTVRRPSYAMRLGLAFTRYCNCQYCVVYIAITGGRGETLYCAIVRAVTVWGGVPKQRVGAQRIVLIRAQRPRHKTISCIGLGPARYTRVSALRGVSLLCVVLGGGGGSGGENHHNHLGRLLLF